MDIDEESVDSLWSLLKSAIQQILRKDNSGLCFSQLYNIAYTLTQQRRGMKMYLGLKEIITYHLSNNVKAACFHSFWGAVYVSECTVEPFHFI